MADQNPEPDERADIGESEDAPMMDAARADEAGDGDDAAALAEEALEQAQHAVDSLKDDETAQGADGQAFDLPDFNATASAADPSRIDLLSDVHLRVKVELGRTRMYVEDVLRLNAGSVVELDKPAGDPVDIYVNDRHVARGEVLVVNDSFCVRISEIVSTGNGRG